MATTIVPALGHAPLLTQQGTGTSPGFDAIDIRRLANGDMQEGVLNASDFMVVQRAAGANLSVDVGMPAGGLAYVQGDTVSGQGLYPVPVHSATINQPLTAANATNPRIDQIVIRLFDNVHDASGSNVAQIDVLTGTATAGATLANRTGALALPGNALLLADVLVGATATTIDNTKIRDRRKWARGAYGRFVRNANAAAGNDYTTATSTSAAVDATNLTPRVECSGVPLRVIMSGQFLTTVIDDVIGIELRLDGAVADGGQSSRYTVRQTSFGYAVESRWDISPAAGSHTVAPWFFRATGSGTISLLARSTIPLLFTVEEIARQNTANNTTTTG